MNRIGAHRVVRHLSTAASNGPAAARRVDPATMRPLIKLYHEAENFPGPTNQELVDYIDRQVLLTANPIHRSSPLALEKAAITKTASANALAELQRQEAAGVGSPGVWRAPAEAESRSAARWQALADALCGTEANGRAGYEVTLEQAARAPAVPVELSKEHDQEQSDIDGEGGEVGRPEGAGRDEKDVPKPAKIKSPGEKNAADDAASSLDGEGGGVGRTSGGGKDGQ